MTIRSRRHAGPRTRGSAARVLACAALAAAVAAAACGGCGPRAAEDGRGARGESSRRGAGPPASAARVTEDGFVSFVAALTVAVEEGRRGEDARRRAEELGSPDYAREEVEAFAAWLREDPERWVRLALLIDARTGELRSGRAARATEAASRPSPPGAP